MDKTVLIEYADMKEEIKDLRKRIDKDQRAIERLSMEMVADSVNCGRKGKKPLKTVRINGIPHVELSKKKRMLNMRMMKLQQLEMDLIEKQMQVEEYIEQIEKSELRLMFRLYYIDDMTWYKVALQMNQHFPKRRIKYTEDNCKQRHKRYFEKVL